VGARSYKPAPRAAPELLWKRPEGCYALAGEVLVGLQLTAVKTAWLPDIRAALARASDRHGGPVQSLSVFRLDARFPLKPGFDSNMAELAETYRFACAHVRGIAVVLEFGGVHRAIMRASIKTVSTLARAIPPVSVHDSAPSGVHWLVGHGGISTETAHDALTVLQDIKRELGCKLSGV
jgi:hypothetical protein